MSMLNGSVEEDSVGTLDLRLFIVSIYFVGLKIIKYRGGSVMS